MVKIFSSRKQKKAIDILLVIIFKPSLPLDLPSEKLVDATGVEPVTSSMSRKHSNQLSYASKLLSLASLGTVLLPVIDSKTGGAERN